MKRRFVDALQREIIVSWPPKRIISLVPSISETLAALKLEQELIAVTKFCERPVRLRKGRVIIGGTKDPKIEEILALKADLIIANKEENRREDVEALQEHFPVYVTDVINLDDAILMIEALGALTDRLGEAEQLSDKIRDAFRRIPEPEVLHKVLYFIWRRPWMVAGRDTFIADILRRGGLVSCLDGRYPSKIIEDLEKSKPELLLFSSEPYPFNEGHLRALEGYFSDVPRRLVDGVPFSWYGPALLEAPALLRELGELFRSDPH